MASFKYSCPDCGEALEYNDKRDQYECTGCTGKWGKVHIEILHDRKIKVDN